MKTLFIYVIAWTPPGGDLTFRHTRICAYSDDEAYSLGSAWAHDKGLLPAPGPANDYIIPTEEKLV